MPHRPVPAQYRYHEVPTDAHFLPLFAAEWLHLEKLGDPPHFHSALEIGRCLEGDGELMYGSALLPYSPGAVIVTPAFYPHTTYANPAKRPLWEYLLVDVEAFLREVYPEDSDMPWRLAARINSRALHLPAGERPAIAGLVGDILATCRAQDDLYRERLKGLLLTLLVEIARAHKDPLKSDVAHLGDTGILHLALQYVGQNYGRKIQVRELAEACHISESHFRRLFSHCMRQSPVAYINDVRIQAACRMLTASGHSVNDVAARCGFGALSTFHRAFRAATGLSPRAWRAALPKGRHQELSGSI